MCGGIISESLVQLLATEGINLPSTVVQRGIDSYILHMDVGSVRIETPLDEKRIAAVHRGAGPRGIREKKWGSFDGHLLKLAVDRGARMVRERVERIEVAAEYPSIKTGGGPQQEYDLLALAVGVNSVASKFLEQLAPSYRPPLTTKTFISEYYLGEDLVRKYVGSSMHVFLLNIPRLEFAAVIPKGDYATACMLGTNTDKSLVQSFLDSPEVKACFPPDWSSDAGACQCKPKMNVGEAGQPFADRIVFVGDCGVSRLNKDGIGAAYRTAKAAASTAVFHGISAETFRRHYSPACKAIVKDNAYGKVAFFFTRQVQKSRLARRALRRMVVSEQTKEGRQRRMSQVMWDLFTGSTSYRDVFLRTLHPAFLWGFLRDVCVSVSPKEEDRKEEMTVKAPGALGSVYEDGAVIVRQGDVGDCMYVIQEGRAQVFLEKEGVETLLRVLEEGEIIGEMAIFDREVRSATVRALGAARVLTVDKDTFLRRVHEDPSLAVRIVQTMSKRIRQLSDEVRLAKNNGI
jgi:flavin-dependent dehydrogenase